MTNRNNAITAEHAFALHSGERAKLHFWSDHYTSIRLESKTFPREFNLVAVVSQRLPDGCAVHSEGILGQVAEAAAQMNDKLPSFWSDFRTMAEKSLERDIAILGIKVQARELLGEYAHKASLEVDVMASRDKQAWLKQLQETLAARIDRLENFPNKQFRGLAEATARCVLLYQSNPDAYATLMGRITKDETDVFLDSLAGLATLDRMVHGLGDDHDYVFNPQTKAVEYQSEATGNQLGLVPQTFLEIVNNMSAHSPT